MLQEIIVSKAKDGYQIINISKNDSGIISGIFVSQKIIQARDENEARSKYISERMNPQITSPLQGQ